VSEENTKAPQETQDRDDTQVVAYIQRCRKEAMDASGLRRDAWQELWSVYQNRQDTSGKMSWQSKLFVPKIWMKVERASAEVKRAVLNIDKLFKFVPIYPPRPQRTGEDQIDREALNKWVAEKEILDDEIADAEREFKLRLENTNLSQVYPIASKVSFLLGLGWPKVLWEDDDLHYEVAETGNVHVSPDYMGAGDKWPKYLIEDQEIDLADLKETAEEVNEASGEEVYNMAAIDRLTGTAAEEAGDGEASNESKSRSARGIKDYQDTSKRVKLWHFWGDIVDDRKDSVGDESRIERRMLCVVGDSRELIRIQPIPFDHQKPPHIATVPIDYPHRGIAGTSLVESSAKLQYTLNNVLNMFIDNLNFTVNKTYEYNPKSLMDANSIFSIFPGRAIPTRSTERTIHEVQTGVVDKSALEIVRILVEEIDEATAVTEFLMGTASTGNKTATEVETKTAESRGLFDVIAKGLEQTSIKPLLKMSYSLLVQFAGFMDIEGKAFIRVNGLSMALVKKQQAQNIANTMILALQSPELSQRTDVGILWKKMLDTHDLGDAFKDPEAEGMPSPEEIMAKAEQDAKSQVEQMTPEQIMNHQSGQQQPTR
jgi:hypothetical protein